MEYLQFVVALVYFLCMNTSDGCKTAEWRNMSMEELLFQSDVVVYGKDVYHGKLRLPTELDARFDVYCVLKAAKYHVPGQVIIEDITSGDVCSGVKDQTTLNGEYIVGLVRQFSGFMRYANVNPMQPTAFPATKENLEKVMATCGLDEWTPPKTGRNDRCPDVYEPLFCTKIRPPTSAAPQVIYGYSTGLLFTMLVSLILTLCYVH